MQVKKTMIDTNEEIKEEPADERKITTEEIYDMFMKVLVGKQVPLFRVICLLKPVTSIFQEIKATHLQNNNHLMIKIEIIPGCKKRKKFRSMLYNFKEPFLHHLGEKLNSVNLSCYNITTADKDYFIEDQEDLYCAIIRYAKASDGEEMILRAQRVVRKEI